MPKKILFGTTIEPKVNMNIASEAYDEVNGCDFDHEAFNALLLAALTYADVSGYQIDRGMFPWAEQVEGGLQ